jgi:hypothetical protein
MSEPGSSPKRRRAGPLDVAKAVFWSFFGIRKSAAHERDATSLTMLQVVVAGLVGAALLVLALVTLVLLVTR